VYPGTLEDESPYVEELAARCHNLERYVATPDGTDLFEVLRRSVWHFDEPTWGPAVYSWWHVMRLARSEGVTVLLNGQGSDELLAGYPLYYPTYLRQLLVSGRWGRFIRETRQQARKDGVSFLGMLRVLALPLWPDFLRRGLRRVGLSHSFDDSYLTPEF